MIQKTTTFVLLILAMACTAQEKINYVKDNAAVLSKKEAGTLSNMYHKHEKKSSNQIVLVTVNTIGDAASIKEYAMNFGNKYGVGQAGKDNGLIIAMDMGNRDIYIATGYGMEKIFEDSEVKAIIDDIIIPKFKIENYYKGLLKGSKAIIKHLEKPENMIFTDD